MKIHENSIKFIQYVITNNRVKLYNEVIYKEKISGFSFKIAKSIIEKKIDYQIEDSIKDYFALDTSEIAYSFSSNKFLYGGFKINGFTETFVQTSTFWKFFYDLGPSDEVPENLKHFEKLNWFEQQSYSDDGRFGCFIREEGSFPPPIAFFDSGWYTEMDITLEEYFNAMFASCAVKGWQYFYIDWNQEIPYREEALKDMQNAVDLLPDLFPEMDFSYHNSKLDEVKALLSNRN